MTKPTRWCYPLWDSDDERRGLRSGALMLGSQAYYRKLVAYYVGEARRWHKIALRNPEVQRAYEVAKR